MSVRPREAFEASQSFSLRDALGADPATPQPPSYSGGGLTFNLDALAHQAVAAPLHGREPLTSRHAQPPSALTMRFAQTPVAETKSTFVQQPAPTPLQGLNFTGMSILHGAGTRKIRAGSAPATAATNEQTNTRADVMRLTAYVDDLTNRLKQTQSRLDKTEAHLTRTSQVLCHERQASDQMLRDYKRELIHVRETEARLRADAAAHKSTVAACDSETPLPASTAVADEHIRLQQRNLAELETKVKAMSDAKVQLETQVTKLEELKTTAAQALEEMRAAKEACSSDGKASADEIALARHALLDIKADHERVRDRLAVAKAEETTLRSVVDTLTASRTATEAAVATAKAETQIALSAHGEAARSLASVEARVAHLVAKERTAREALEEIKREVETLRQLKDGDRRPGAQDEQDEQGEGATPTSCTGVGKGRACDHSAAQDTPPPEAARVAAPAARERRKGVITGAAAPDRPLCSGVPENDVALRARCSWGSAETAAVSDADAPTGLTLRHVAFIDNHHCLLDEIHTGDAAGDAETMMVNAVVGDLKERFTELSKQQPVWRSVAPLV